MENFKGTQGPWVYSPERDTHDSIIHSAIAKEEHGYINNNNGGVVGSSEWIWIKDEDAKLIVTAPELFELLSKMRNRFQEYVVTFNEFSKPSDIDLINDSLSVLKKATE